MAFVIKNAAKDIGYYNQMCADAGVQSLTGHSTQTALDAACANGQADDMVSTMVDYHTSRFSQV